jgi:signal transduction histidine kinase
VDTGSLLWFLAVIFAGLAAGAMLGEFLLLGPFQSWFFETGNSEMFRKSYLLFRRTKRASSIFNAVYVIAILTGLAYLAFLLFTGKLGVLPVVAVVSQLLFLLVFYGSGFAKLESEIFQGNTSKELADKFRLMNVPSLGIYALLWCASFCVLVFMRVQ